MRLLDAAGWGQHLLVHRHYGFEQAGDSRSGFSMTNVGFDRANDRGGRVSSCLPARPRQHFQFGGIAEGTVRVAAKRSGLQEYPLTIVSGKQHVEALSHALAYFGETARKAIDQADEIGDKGTADIFTEISRGVDKDLWFVEAHAQADH